MWTTTSKTVPHSGSVRRVIDITFDKVFNTGQFKFFGTNGTDPTANADAEGGTLVLTTAGADNDGNFLQTNEFIRFDRLNEHWEFQAKVKFSDDDQIDSYFVVAATPGSDSAILTSIVDGLGYVSPDGAADIALQVVKDSTDVGSTSDYDQDTSAHWLRIEVDTGSESGIGDVRIYRDNVLLEEAKGVQLPDNEELAIIIGSAAGEAAAKTTTVYRIMANIPDPDFL